MSPPPCASPSSCLRTSATVPSTSPPESTPKTATESSAVSPTIQTTSAPGDVAIYYPHPNGESGYVYYDGIIDGWSDYDNQWYRANIDAEARLLNIINLGSPKPYIAALSDDGTLTLFDLHTLEKEADFSLDLPVNDPVHLSFTDHGKALLVHTQTATFSLNWANLTACETSLLPNAEATRHHANAMALAASWNAQDGGAPIEVIDATAWEFYFHYPAGEADLGRGQGGVITVDPEAHTVNRRLQQTREFTQVVHIQGGFYTLEPVSEEGSTRFSYFDYGGVTVSQLSLEGEAWLLGYIMADAPITEGQITSCSEAVTAP